MARQTIWWRAGLLLSLMTVAVMSPALATGQAAVPAEEAPTAEDTVAQEAPTPEDLAFFQWSVRYRFGRDLEEGDWVRYQMAVGPEQQEIEIRVTGTDDRGVWIAESYKQEGGTAEIHLLVDPKAMRLVDGFSVSSEGTKESTKPLPEERVDEIVKQVIAEQMAQMPLTGVAHCADKELTGAFGSLVCSCLEGVYREELVAGWTPDQLEQMLQPMRMYLSEDVPRLLPMQTVVPWAFFAPEDFGAMKGGLVQSRSFMLTDYGKGGS